jgi:2-C-methyl-D-erythritol 4-phosphate cytidylyltransferase
MVPGLPQNLKITTPEDLKAARLWIPRFKVRSPRR